MNRFFGSALIMSLMAISTTPAIAQPTVSTFQEESSALAQEQINLLTEIEESLYSTQISFVQGSRRNLSFHINALDYYRNTYGQGSATQCTSSILNDAELEMYCTLFNSRSLLFDLLATLDGRQDELGNAETSLVNRGGGDPLLPFGFISQETWQSEWDTFDVVVIDDAKPSQNQGDITRSAIAPLPETTAAITTQISTLLALNSVFPNGLQLEEDTTFTTTTPRFHYVPLPEEYEWHAEFLAQPNTGLTRLMPREAYEENYNASILKPKLTERFPFPQLGDSEPFPNLPLFYENDEITFMPEAFNLGLIADLGEIDFSGLSNLDNTVTQYNSPTTFEALQQEQRRFLFKEDGRSLSTAPLQLDHVYLVRLIQYNFADEILTGEPLPRYRYRELNLLADPDSYDVLLAIQPVKKWLGGEYTLLWQVIDRSEATELVDLIDYITVTSPQ